MKVESSGNAKPQNKQSQSVGTKLNTTTISQFTTDSNKGAESHDAADSLDSVTTAAALFLQSHSDSSPLHLSASAIAAIPAETTSSERIHPMDLGKRLLAHFERELEFVDVSRSDDDSTCSSSSGGSGSVALYRKRKATRAGLVLGDTLNPILRAGDKVSLVALWDRSELDGFFSLDRYLTK